MASTSTASLVTQSLTNPTINAQLRASVMQSALRQYKMLSPATGYSAGQTARIRLQNVGILNSLEVLVSMTVTNNAASGGAALVPSVGFPYNLLRKVTTRDFAGKERVDLSGFNLYLRNAIHNGRAPYAVETLSEGGFTVTPQAYPTSSATGAIAAASSATIQFYVKIPVSISDGTTLGALLMQALTGEAFVEFQVAENHSTGGYDHPFTGDFSITNASFTVCQNYLQPQVNPTTGVNPLTQLPGADLSTVYELKELSTNSDLAVGQSKYINFPNARIVHSVTSTFFNGALNYGTDLQSVKIIASGNTYLDERLPQLWIEKLRDRVAQDFPAVYWSDHSRLPISTDLYGQVQQEFVPASLGSNPYIRTMFESTYMVNTPLPGLSS